MFSFVMCMWCYDVRVCCWCCDVAMILLIMRSCRNYSDDESTYINWYSDEIGLCLGDDDCCCCMWWCIHYICIFVTPWIGKISDEGLCLGPEMAKFGDGGWSPGYHMHVHLSVSHYVWHEYYEWLWSVVTWICDVNDCEVISYVVDFFCDRFCLEAVK